MITRILIASGMVLALAACGEKPQGMGGIWAWCGAAPRGGWRRCCSRARRLPCPGARGWKSISAASRSNPSSSAPAWDSQWSSRARACWIDASPAQTTIRAGAAGTSRSVAAVTMPSVPSEPMNNCFRSQPRLSFFSGVSAE